MTTGVGVVVPYDFALDRELWSWVPPSVTLHVTRTPFRDLPVTAGQARVVGDPSAVHAATRDVMVPVPGVVAYGCTSGSFVRGVAGERELRDAMLAAGAPRVVTTSGALVQACAELGVSRLAVVTPYVDDLTLRLGSFLAECGVAVVSSVGLGLLGEIWRVPVGVVVDAVRAVDLVEADAVFVSCTNLATGDVLGELGRELGKPVLSANLVTMWAALREVGLPLAGGLSMLSGLSPREVAGVAA